MEPTVENLLTSAAVGPYATKEGRAYLEGGYMPETEKNTANIQRAQTEAGIPATVAQNLSRKLKTYEKDAEKRAYINNQGLLTNDQKAWMEHNFISSKETYEKAEQAKARGISYKVFYRVRNADKDGNGRLSKEEAVNAIKTQNLTESQKAYLFELQNKEWKNPFKK